jgi:hypothetical protein
LKISRRVALAGVGVVAAASLVIQGTLAANAATVTTTHPTMTYAQQHTGQGQQELYDIYTENGGKLSDTLQLTKVGAAFIPALKVLRASSGGWIYPNVGAGAERGMRPADTWYPVRIGYDGRSAGNVWLRSATTLVGSGSYNAAYDVWFEPVADTTGARQSFGGAEVMIWNAAKRNGRWIYNGPGRYYGKFSADGMTWNVNGSRVGTGSHSWMRLYFVATRPLSFFNGSFSPFMTHAGQLGYLKQQWYLTGIDYGFEVDQGGTGLAVTNVSVTGVR